MRQFLHINFDTGVKVEYHGFTRVKDNAAIVLARIASNDASQGHRWVTWVAYNHGDRDLDPWATGSGHYFETAEEARADYAERITRGY